MDDAKKTYREGEQWTKETARKSDGDDSVKDKMGNAGDDLRRQAHHPDRDPARDDPTVEEPIARRPA